MCVHHVTRMKTWGKGSGAGQGTPAQMLGVALLFGMVACVRGDEYAYEEPFIVRNMWMVYTFPMLIPIGFLIFARKMRAKTQDIIPAGPTVFVTLPPGNPLGSRPRLSHPHNLTRPHR